MTPPGGTAGFTLVELLLVVAALAILGVTAGMAVTRPSAQAPGDAERLLALDAALRQEALLSRSPVGLLVDADGAARAAPSGEGWAEAAASHAWAATADWAAPQGVGRKLLAYLPDGRNTPWEVVLRDGPVPRLCVSDGWSLATCDAP